MSTKHSGSSKITIILTIVVTLLVGALIGVGLYRQFAPRNTDVSVPASTATLTEEFLALDNPVDAQKWVNAHVNPNKRADVAGIMGLEPGQTYKNAAVIFGIPDPKVGKISDITGVARTVGFEGKTTDQALKEANVQGLYAVEIVNEQGLGKGSVEVLVQGDKPQVLGITVGGDLKNLDDLWASVGIS